MRDKKATYQHSETVKHLNGFIISSVCDVAENYHGEDLQNWNSKRVQRA